MWEALTQDVKEAIVEASEEAKMYDANFIGTEHLLLGLLKKSEKARLFFEEFITIDYVYDCIERLIGKRATWPPSKKHLDFQFTPRFKKAIEYAFSSARENDDTYVDVYHVIVGMLSDGGVAFDVINTLKYEDFNNLLAKLDLNIINKKEIIKDMNITFTMPGTNLKVSGPAEEALALYKDKATNEWPLELKTAVLETGDFYVSEKHGLMKVEDMNTVHLRNAVLKMYKEVHVEGLRNKGLLNKELVTQLNTFPTNKTLVKMMFELSKRADV